ncbi:carboxypeptidase regulatory-like domain-containing protein [Halpernia frigidisoli]|uniref:Outer membrane receptor proteins, mostly Fe transport n=1 Tax=Halpernia frigidisoli TaxID=1125876 RepID=A0A1I3DBD4_9FLAO|nr:carboxypeptidase regulatory-like domain-containing protein [Halpernia frigidisoli]SFH83899.1 Outer membrane receptor proteins, mostly Fe transport [Halpernia frigidisoli]
MKFFTILFIIFSLKISAQTEIRGSVIDDHKRPLASVNIILLNSKDNIITFVFSSKDGSFVINSQKTGDFKLKITALNFHPNILDISIINKNKPIDLGKITLVQLKETEIKEVVISRKIPIRVKKDTIEYSVKSFSNGTEQNVEDLLKKLPGIKIDKDGKIKYGDKEVDHVLVENDDLFERGYQTLTQNMPSQPLKSVQVLKHYSKNKLLKGVENSESIALNLTLKEDAKDQWFGSVLLASTSYKEDMRQAKFNLMNFSKKKKFYLLFNGNNLGLDEMNGVEYLINPSSDKDVENVGGNINTLSILNLHQKNYQFEDKRTNFNNDKLASLNYINNFKNNWKLKFVTIFNQTENRNFTESLYRYNYQGLNFTNTQSKTWQQQKQNIVAKIELVKDFKQEASLKFYNKFSWLQEDNDNSFIFNGTPNNQLGDNRLFSSENKAVYTKKIDSSQAFVAVVKFISQNRPYHFREKSNVFQSLLKNENAQNILENINSDMYFGGGKLSYLKKYAEDHNLEIQIGDEFRNNNLTSDISVFSDSGSEINFEKSAFKNNIHFRQNKLFAQGKYNRKIKKLSFGGNLLTQIISTNFNENKDNQFIVSPILNISFESKNFGSLSLSGGRSFSQTNINDLNINYIYSGNRSFQKSDVGFRLLPSYNFNIGYSIGSELSDQLIFNASYFRNEDYLSNNVIVNPDYSLFQKILVKNNHNISGNLQAKRYIKFISSRFSLIGSYFNSDYQNSVNKQPLITTKFSNAKAGFEMKSGWTKFLNYELGYNFTFNNIRSDINSNKYTDQKGFVNLYFRISQVFNLLSNYEIYRYGSTAQRSIQFLDLNLDYKWTKYKMNLFIKGNNLLNVRSIQRYSIDNISESLYTQRLISRNILFGINKNF